MRLLRLSLALVVVLSLALVAVPPPRAALAQAPTGIEVTDNGNTPDTFKTDNGKCSLWEALQAAAGPRTNDDCGPDPTGGPVLITFAPSVTTAKLEDDLPDITTNVAILGPVTLDFTNVTTIGFDVEDQGILSLTNLVVRKAAYTAIDSRGIVNIAGVSFDSNKSGVDGGAIRSSGKLNIAGANFVGNESPSTGGAISLSGGQTLIAGTAFNGNSAGEHGGAIDLNTGKLEIYDSVFNGNIATGGDTSKGGGAIYITNSGNVSPTLVIRSVFNGNLSPEGVGGAIFYNVQDDDFPLNIRDSSFQGNLAGIPTEQRNGGAIMSWGLANIYGSTFLNNAAAGDGGAIALEDDGKLVMANSTFSANAAGDQGGAIAIQNTNYATVTTNAAVITNVTFGLNVAPPGGGGTFFNDDPRYDLLRLTNTIISGVSGVDSCADNDNDDPTVDSLGHNLDTGNGCGLDGTGDLTDANAALQAPFFNGGPLASLLTQMPSPASDAIDTGDGEACAAAPVNNVDQRGFPRGADGDGAGGGSCDMGALEAPGLVAGFGSTPQAPGPIDLGNAQVNQGELTSVISVFETGNKALTVNNPQLGGANAADFSVSGLPISISDGGSAKEITVTCAPKAVGERIASLTLSTNDPNNSEVVFGLRCTGTPQPVPGFGSSPAAPGPLGFGLVNVGEPKNLTFQLVESGDTTLTVSNPQIGGLNPGDFSVVVGLPASIANNAAPQNVTIRCTPTDQGVRSATLTVTTNDPTRPTVEFTLTCEGRIPPEPPLSLPGDSLLNNGSAGSPGPYGLAVSPDGRDIYVADSGDDLLTHFRIDDEGDLTRVRVYAQGGTDGAGNSISGIETPRRVAVSPDGDNVYVTGNASDSVTAFGRNPETGALTFLDFVTEGESYGCRLVIGNPPQCTGTIDGLNGAHGVVVSPDNKYVYVSSNADDAIVVFTRDPSDGGLVSNSLLLRNPRFVQSFKDATNLNGARGIVVSPDGTNLYVAALDGDRVTALSRNADGRVGAVLNSIVDGQFVGNPPFLFQVESLDEVFDLAISPDGRDLYVTSLYSTSGTDGALVRFRRDTTDGGRIRYGGAILDSGNSLGADRLGEASGVAVSPDGQFVYVGAYRDDAVTVFSRNPSTGTLIEVVQEVSRAVPSPALGGPRLVAISPDGGVLYVTAFDDNALVALPFARVPVLTSLSPASAQAGGAAFTLTVNGEGFAPNAKVYWNFTERPTTFVNSTQLRASIAAGDIGGAGAVSVEVRNPGLGGGDSNRLDFTITAVNQNPVPSITQISPEGAPAGSGGLLVTISGAGFTPVSAVLFNGEERESTYIGPTSMQVQLLDGDTALPGLAGISVRNPAPGGGTSTAAAFTVAAPGQNPTPSITSLSPASANAGSLSQPQLVVTLIGAGFIPGVQVSWNGAARPTTYVNGTTVRVTLSSGDLQAPGAYSVVATNPAPGGGDSNTATFTVGTAGSNPVPAITSIGVAISGGRIVLQISGSGFAAGATVRVNGQVRTPSSLAGNFIRVPLNPGDYRPALVSVTNPTPGGGQSNEALLAVRVMVIPLLRR